MIALSSITAMARNGRHWVLADQLMVSGTTFLTVILAARGMDAHAFGVLSFVMLAQLLLLTFQNALITNPYLVLQADHRSKDPKGYTGAVILLESGFMSVLLIPGVLLYIVAPSWIGNLSGCWWYILLLMTGYLIQDLLRRIFLAEKKERRAFVIDALTNVLQLAGLFFLFVRHRLHLASCVFVMGVTFLPSIVLGMYWLDMIRPTRVLLRQALWEHLEQGKWLAATSLLQWWAGNSFIVAAGVLLDVTAFGALRLAQNIFGVLNVLLQAFENYVIPHSAALHLREDFSLQAYLRRIARKAGWFLLPCLLLMALGGKYLLMLTGGKQYISYYRIIPELSLLYLFIFAGYPIRIAIRVLRMNSAFFTAYVFSSLFSLLAAGTLVRSWGMEGVVAGLLINQGLLIGYWYFALSKKNFYGNNTCSAGKS